MKKTFVLIVACIFVAQSIYSQKNNKNQKADEAEKGIFGDWVQSWTDFNTSKNNHLKPADTLSGIISEDKELKKNTVYLLSGNVFVTNKAILKIQPGTTILCDYKTKASLTITKGAKIQAKGSSLYPIVFTSNRSDKRPGDWGGITIIGDGIVNGSRNLSVAKYYSKLNNSDYANLRYGGTNNTTSSGIMRFVRIEFAGKQITSNAYSNGLLLAGVGDQTRILNVMVSHCAGNSFELLGGKTKLIKLISYQSQGTDFKLNYGAECSLYNSVAIRSPFVSNNLGARCLEVLSYDKKQEFDFSKKGSTLKAKNVTFINISKNLKENARIGLIKESIRIGDNVSVAFDKSVISGFNPAVVLYDDIAKDPKGLKKIRFTQVLFNNCTKYVTFKNSANSDAVLAKKFTKPELLNEQNHNNYSETFVNVFSKSTPDFRLKNPNKVLANNDIEH